MNEEVSQAFLREVAPHIELIHWGGGMKALSEYKDTRTGSHFTKQQSEVVRNLKRNPNTIFGKNNKLTETSVQKFLSEIAPHIKLIKFSETSLFKDTNRDIEFTEVPKVVLGRLRSDPTFLFAPTKSEIVKKRQTKIMDKYGVLNALQNPDLLKKSRDTLEANYGVRSPLHSSIIKDRILRTNVKRYGATSPAMNTDVKNKTAQTCKVLYGGAGPQTSQSVRLKSIVTCNSRYGVSTYNKSKKAKIATSQYLLNGQPLSEIESSFSVSYLRALASKGVALDTLPEKGTLIEQRIKATLDELDVTYVQDRSLGPYKPDFRIDSHKLIIECDGLYWHSDKVISDKSYHIKKKQTYADLGYVALFLREGEILDHPDIVKSIIGHKLGKSTSIYARTCLISHSTSSDFFVQNHLMGAGTGRIYSLEHCGTVVAAMQVRWKDKTLGVLEVSRFCTSLNTSVVGGFSKLLKYVEAVETPTKIINFVDLRYGTGAHLLGKGFTLVNTSPSFVWTKGLKSAHRMKFPGSTGYDHGWAKLWDCGQAKYVKVL